MTGSKDLMKEYASYLEKIFRQLSRKTRQLTWLGGVMAAVLMTGCASSRMPDVLDFGNGPSDAKGWREIKQETWPPLTSGEQPRYRYAGELYGEENFHRSGTT